MDNGDLMNAKTPFLLALLWVLLGCSTASEPAESAAEATEAADSAAGSHQPGVELAGWSEASHGKGAAPAWDALFGLDQVHRIDITMPGATYQAMLDDLEALMGSPDGSGGGGPPGGGGGGPPAEAFDACTGADVQAECQVALGGKTIVGTCQAFGGGELVCVPAGGGGPSGPGGGPGGGGPGNLVAEDPSWVPVTISHDGRVWPFVGMRFKGNSSLNFTWKSGGRKFGFRLTFDKFEDDHVETKDQRFYGFKKMTFAPAFGDASMLRDVLAAELFRAHGLVVARAAFYEVWVDSGDGPIFWGLYTMIEDPADQLVERAFPGDTGNMYKPEGSGANFTAFDPAGFPKKTNESEADWSDVEAAIAALHADRSDAAAWRQKLESAFDVDTFLAWLAANQTLQNWDVYGAIAHNYYLYGDPTHAGRLTWIPWDHNESLKPGKMGDSSMAHTGVGEQWPLIRFLLDDPVYRQRYTDEVAAFMAGPFHPDALFPLAEQLHALVAPSVAAEAQPYSHLPTGVADFTASLETGSEALFPHVEARRAAAQALLDGDWP